jgi:hypothetical protein
MTENTETVADVFPDAADEDVPADVVEEDPEACYIITLPDENGERRRVLRSEYKD